MARQPDPQAERDGDQALLGAVVEVALDVAPRAVGGVQDPRPRGAHLRELRLGDLVLALRALAGRAGLPVQLETVLPAERLPTAVEAAAYFAVSEALTNVARYAEASHASVGVDERDAELVVTIVDDGVGGADPSGGSGLQGLRDRLAAVNGTLDIDSRPGEGTRLRARLPSR